MSEIKESELTGLNGYLVTATLSGESVQNIVAISRDKDYGLSDAERQRIMHDSIRGLAFDKWGERSSVHVTWVKAKASTLRL
jgi:hypothetical protein